MRNARQAQRTTLPMKVERWNPLADPSAPLRWTRRWRRAEVAVDLFDPTVANEQIDAAFGIMLACGYFEGMPRHRFIVETRGYERLGEYLCSPPAALLRRWAEAADHLVHMDDGEWFSVHIGARCGALWSRDGTALTKVEPWSRPENLFPLRHVEIDALREWERGDVLPPAPAGNGGTK